MLNIHTLTLGDYQTNCYLVWADSSKTCAVIDPGYDPEVIFARVKELGLTVDTILLTHGHFDHVGAVKEIVQKTGCKLWMSQADYTRFKTPENDFFYPLHDCDFTEVWFCEDGEEITAGGVCFTVMETPGHTYGSVCYFCGDAMFSGDTLFAGSCGRTDLPGGSTECLRNSLERLRALEENYTVYPGHGPKTTLCAERLHNPYLR